jgi:hypothetical protein
MEEVVMILSIQCQVQVEIGEIFGDPLFERYFSSGAMDQIEESRIHYILGGRLLIPFTLSGHTITAALSTDFLYALGMKSLGP